MSRWAKWGWRALAAVVVVGIPAYFAIGAAPDFFVSADVASVTPGPVDKPIQIARTLEKVLAREIEQTVWRPNKPWFYPTAFADNKTNFQLGVLHGVRRSLLEYASRTIRARADGAVDPDLQAALNQLQYPPDVWLLDVSQGFGASSESQYREALAALRAFEARAQGEGQFGELRPDHLLRFVDALNLDLMAHVLTLQDYGLTKAWVVDTRADDVFYQTKGAAFVYAALAQAVKHDFADILAQKHLGDLWSQFETNIDRLAQFAPLTVVTAPANSVLLPNHLIVQAFYASRCAEILSQIEASLRT
jgi:hypothetical protein